jgi:Domain of unknown function (DUF4129)
MAEKMTGLRRYAPLLAVGALLAGTAVAAALATPQITSVPALRIELRPETQQPPGAGARASEPVGAATPGAVQHNPTLPGWLTGTLSVVCLVLLAAAVGAILWGVLRDRLTARRGAVAVAEPALATQRDRVLAAVDAGLSGLDDADADPRRAVIACWVRLEEAAAAAGTPRRPGDTPTDLVLRLLAAHQVSAPVLYPLAEVYRLARYATHTVDDGMRDQARAALRQLRAELSAQPAGVTR